VTFLNPFYLIGLAAASLPVLFHLFARKRSRRVEFSSLRFLQKLEKTSMRAVKIRQILLLIVRTLLIIALVMAFARPALKGYLGGFFGSSHANTSMVFLIDNSASMSRSDERGQLLKQAKDAATSIANLMAEGDEATVIPMGSIQAGVAPNPVHTRRDILNAIAEVKVADRPATLGDGLRVASATLAKSLNVNKEVYLFSDDQSRNLKESGIATADTNSTKLFDASTKFYTMPLGNGEQLKGHNVSLDSLQPVTTVFEPGRPVQFEAWVRNTTGESAENMVLSLFYNEDRVAQKTITSIGANASERVSIEGPIRGSGLIAVHASLEQDALPFDNNRYTVINVPASRRIGIFLSDPSKAAFLNLALSQTLAETQGGLPFASELKRVEDLRSLGASSGQFDAIIVGLGPQSLGDADRSALKDYVASGHGACIMLMPGLDIVSVNRDLAAFGLPVINRKEGSPNDPTHYLSFAQFDFAHPFFSGMFAQVSTTGNALRGIVSPKLYENYDLASNVGLPLIKLSNGSPFLVEAKVGKGGVLLYSVPPTLDYSDLPRKSIFLPLMRRTASYVSSIRTMRDENYAAQYVTTEPFDVELPALGGLQTGATVLVKAPDGSSQRAHVTITTDGKTRIHIEGASVAGNYTVYRDAEAREPVALFAVNVESNETDLKTATEREMKDYLAARMTAKKASIITLQAGERDLAKVVEQSRYGVELWQSFLWAALVLAVFEMILAAGWWDRA